MVLQPNLVPDELLTYTTEDGWTASIRRYRGSGPPVLLVHGMGANHYNWDFREEVSFAAHLQALGWDVFVPELRGDPGAVGPDPRSHLRYDFDDHADFDVPAILDVVLAEAGTEQLYWVGHSMGGMLLYTALATSSDRIAAGVAICAPSGFEHPGAPQRTLARIGVMLPREGVFRRAAIMQWGLLLGERSPVFRQIANRKNLDREMLRGLVTHALVDLPWPMARQASTWVKKGALTRRDGSPWLRPSDVPLLVMGAPLDMMAPEADVRATTERFANVTYRQLSVAGGFKFDYGHVDPLLGTHARGDVYPAISAWLENERSRSEERPTGP